MLKKRWKELLLTAVILPCLIQPASAHVVWFDYQNGEYDILFGHPEDGPEPYAPSKFKEATVYDASRQTIPFTINQKEDGLSLTPNSQPSAITGFFDNGFFARTDTGSKQIAESEVKDYGNVGHYLKYTKAFYDWSDTLAKPYNQPLEIIPLQNPLDVKPGDSLQVKVLYQGNQISDAVVEHLGKSFPVDNNGIFSVPIGIEGLQQLEAGYSLPAIGNLRTSYEASLTAQRISVPEPSALLGLVAFGTLLGVYNKKKQLPSNN